MHCMEKKIGRKPNRNNLAPWISRRRLILSTVLHFPLFSVYSVYSKLSEDSPKLGAGSWEQGHEKWKQAKRRPPLMLQIAVRVKKGR